MTDTITAVKAAICDYVKRNPGTSFVEIEKIFDEHGFDYKGNKALQSSVSPYIVFWINWNDEAIKILMQLIKERSIKLMPSNKLVYFCDGKSLNIPLYKGQAHLLKSERWAPCEFISLK